MVSMTMTAVDPNGKQHRKCINTNRYSHAECDMIHREYRKWITSGHNPKSFNPDNISIPAQTQAATATQAAAPLFERCHIKDLKIDKSLGGCSFAIIGSTKSGKKTK